MVGVINVRHESRLKGKIQKIYAHVVKGAFEKAERCLLLALSS